MTRLDTTSRFDAASLSALEDDVEALLLPRRADAPYLGCYEGHDRVGAEYRMFLSCPDVDALVAALSPWLRRLYATVRVTAKISVPYRSRRDRRPRGPPRCRSDQSTFRCIRRLDRLEGHQTRRVKFGIRA